MVTLESSQVRFFDCNVYFGLPMRRSLVPVRRVEQLLTEMDRAGVHKALVWHIAQHDAGAKIGNQLVADAIEPHPRLLGCWSALPGHTGEFTLPEVLFDQMRQARVGALRIFPQAHRFIADKLSLGALLEQMIARRVPLFLSLRRGVEWPDIYRLLSEFPDLVCVICDHGVWGTDRLFRPLLESYPNVYLDISHYLLDGGVEALVSRYGATRLLYGSGFPESYFGSMMMVLRHALIPQPAKRAIAGANLERILAEEIL